MVYFAQLLIVGLVMSANVYWEITPNGLAAGVVGLFFALVFAGAVNRLRARFYLRPRRLRP